MTTNHPDSDFLPPVQTDEFLPPLGRWMTLGGLFTVGTVVIVVAIASIAKYKVTVKAPASVRPVGEMRLVQAVAEGPVQQISVKENQSVKRGDVIATIDNSRLQTKKKQLQSSVRQTQLQQVQIKAQIQSLGRQISAETDRINRTVNSAEAQLRGRNRMYQDQQVTAMTEVQEAEANIQATKAALSAAKSKRDRYQSIAKTGAISKERLEEAQSSVDQQVQEMNAARAKFRRAKAALNPTNAEVSIATEQIAQQKAAGQAQLATLTQNREALIQKQIQTNEQLEQSTRELQQIDRELKQTSMTATSDGIIAKLNLRNPGQMVSAGEQIAQIIPNDAPLEVKAAVSPQDIDKVKVGQAIQMWVSACPHPDYGILKGKVNQISKDSIRPQEKGAGAVDPALATQGGKVAPAFYDVTIEPESRSLGHGKTQCELQTGMEGKVDIVTKEETVLQFLLRQAKLSVS